MRVARELQNVVLRDPHVFQQLPGGVRSSRRLDTPYFGWKVFDSRVEVDVSLVAAHGVHKLLMQWFG